MKDEIVRDIDAWSIDQLTRWFADSAVRYEIAGLAPPLIATYVTSTLMMTLAQILAVRNFSPEEAGQKLAEQIEYFRKSEKMRNRHA